jgi:acyl-CoA thioester hydrolase
MSTDEPRVLARVPIHVRWRDLDAYNHVNNATFLTYLEEARLVWLAGIAGEWKSASFSQVNYREPIAWPAELVVDLVCAKLGHRSLTLTHRITSADGQHVHSDASVVMVWVDPATGRPVAVPDAVRQACT